jgi:hypothetical protein
LNSSSAPSGVSHQLTQGPRNWLSWKVPEPRLINPVGAFDIISEFLPHVAIILYRTYPTRHSFLRRLFLWACATTAAGTVIETILTMYLFGSLWTEWTIGFQIATPLLHVAFSAAQVHGTVIFFQMYRRQTQLALQRKEAIMPSITHHVQSGEVRNTLNFI